MAEKDNSLGLTLDLVIKLGGAAITDKSSLETLKEGALRQGAALIKKCLDAGQKLAVVHGAGSFGHHQAKQYKVNDGLNQDRDFTGFCLTRNSVTTLNKHVVECLTEHGVPAVSCPAFPTWQTSQRGVCSWPKEAVRCVLSAGLVPVFHGDGVLDVEQGCCILSGDTIIKTLCRYFRVKRVVFLTDVQGVFDRPPHEEGANLLHCVSFTADGQLCNQVKLTTSYHDVTGGMMIKLHSAHDIVTSSSGQTRVFMAKIGSSMAQTLCLNEDVNEQTLNCTEIVRDNK